MKVIIIGSDSLAFNGRVAKTRRMLEAQGHDVDIMRLHIGELTSPDDDPGADHQIRSDISVPQNSHGLIRRFKERSRFRNLLSQAFSVFDAQSPNALHAMDPYALKAAQLWTKKAKRKPAIIFDACEWFEGTAAGDEATSAYVRKTLTEYGKNLSGWLCPSEALADLYRAAYPDWTDPHIFGNVPDWEPDADRSRLDSPLRKLIGAKPDDTILLFSGALNPGRGLSPLLAGLGSLPKQAHLVFLGYGPMDKQIDAVITAGTYRGIHRLPAVPNAELPKWLCGANAGLIPYREGPMNHAIATPNKLYEYPGAGVPVITTDRPVLAQAVKTNGIGDVAEDALWGQAGTDAADLRALVMIANRLADDSEQPKKLHDFYQTAQSELLPGLTNLYGQIEAPMG